MKNGAFFFFRHRATDRRILFTISSTISVVVFPPPPVRRVVVQSRGFGVWTPEITSMASPISASVASIRSWASSRTMTEYLLSRGSFIAWRNSMLSGRNFSLGVYKDGTASVRHRRTRTCSTTNDGRSINTATELRQSIPLETLRCSPNLVAKHNTTDDGEGIHYELEQRSWSPPVCHQSEHVVAPDTPLPPPTPKPEYSFKRRILPTNLLAFNSEEGKSRFLHSMQTKNAEAYIPLSQQFLSQMDPAYCGVSTLILVLNALAIDPNVRWRGGWRWYGDESMLLERCCLEEERVRREGISLEQFCGLARCQGAALAMKRPFPSEEKVEERRDAHSLDEFRRDVINSVCMPPSIDWDGAGIEVETTVHPSRSNGGHFLVASFARSSLRQTGDGHFSPIAAYHPPTDSCLVLDVARFKYSPFWVPLKELYDAMIPEDTVTGKSRGWILMFPPVKASEGKRRSAEKPISREELEGKRPAACVPLAGTGERICAVERLKIEYCTAGNR